MLRTIEKEERREEEEESVVMKSSETLHAFTALRFLLQTRY